MAQVGPITKLARQPSSYVRSTRYFDSARSALAAYMRSEGVTASDTILLPSYIGWSSREGSGVFDPVVDARCKFGFYRMTSHLTVDPDDFARKLESYSPRMVVLIHYFGFPDPRLSELVTLARAAGAKVLEDEAHAMLSDWIGGVCGRFGDAAIMSLHKLLPVPSGGLLIVNRHVDDNEKPRFGGTGPFAGLLEHDYASIATVRRRNAETLIEMLKPLAGRVDLLFDTLPPGIIPQTLPILIRRISRDRLYFDMNAAGFGVVSLYHTLVDAISTDEFPESHEMSRHIMNMPVHQDIRPGQLHAMVAELARLLRQDG